MDKSFVVQIVKCLCDLAEDTPLGLLFLPVGMLLNQRCQGVSFTVLHLNVKYVNSLPCSQSLWQQ